MKIVFFGSGKFAVKILEAAHNSDHDISLIVTQPDRKKGRHLQLQGTPVKEYAQDHNLMIFAPDKLNTLESLKILKKEKADLFLVVSYGKILSGEVLKIPKIMSVNIHASLLPKYRGAAPIAYALMKGEKKTGVTFIRMNERMDEGDIIFQKAIKIENDDNIFTLEEKLSGLASTFIKGVLSKIEKVGLKLKKQSRKEATYAPLIKKQDGLIQWDSKPDDIFNSFRATLGWPSSFTFFKGKILKVLDMEVGQRQHGGKPGEIIRLKDGGLEVACHGGTILIKEVLPESHHRMPVKSFLAGHNVKMGDRLG